MRVRSLLLPLALSLAVHPAISPTTASAQTPTNASSPCSGTVHIVRVSDIQPGKMDTFLQAAAAQRAWYKSKGTPDEIIVLRVMTQAPDKSWSVSETQAITDHTQPPGQRNLPQDAGYDAFVKLYKDSSIIKTAYITCADHQ